MSKDNPPDAVVHDQQGDNLHLTLGEVTDQQEGEGHKQRGLLDRVLHNLLPEDDHWLRGRVQWVPCLLLADREDELKAKLNMVNNRKLLSQDEGISYRIRGAT